MAVSWLLGRLVAQYLSLPAERWLRQGLMRAEPRRDCEAVAAG